MIGKVNHRFLVRRYQKRRVEMARVVKAAMEERVVAASSLFSLVGSAGSPWEVMVIASSLETVLKVPLALMTCRYYFAVILSAPVLIAVVTFASYVFTL